jgi:putative Mg2+ transporter-C (MgtC) family protein
MLVGLAASVAMIQANILLAIGGKTTTSFGVMDLMRLPLGILTGVGFIGGGAISRRGQRCRRGHACDMALRRRLSPSLGC